MAVKQGFKLTEVGVIPDDWEIAPLSREIDRLEAGTSVNSVDESLRIYRHEQSVLKTSAVSGGQFLPEECKKIAPRDLSRAHLSLRSDSILISRMNTPNLVGECGYVGTDYPNLFLPDRLWMTKKRPGSQCNIRWLSYVLSSDFYVKNLREMATGTSGSMKNIAKRSLMELPIAFPSPLEQEAIATVIGSLDEKFDALDRLIAKKRELRKAAMQQLLTGQTRLPGFSEDWEIRRLGDISKIKTGSRNNEDKVEDGKYPFFVRSEVIERIDSYCYDCEAILVPGEGRIGEIFHYIHGRFDVHQRVYAITSFKPEASARFIYFYLANFFGAWAMKNTVKATVDSLRLPTFTDFIMKIPATLGEQIAIALVLSDIDAELSALEQYRGKTRVLKQGMLQELLTGKTRLVA